MGITVNDIMELLGDAEATTMMSKVKEAYVLKYLGKKKIVKLSNERYMVRVGDDNHQVSSKDMKSLIDKLYDYFMDVDNKNISVRQVYDEYEAVRKNTVTENTILREQQTYKRYITDGFANLPIVDVTEDKLKAFINQRIEDIVPIKTDFNLFMTLITGIFQRAEDKEYIVKNPIHKIHKKDYYKKCKVSSVDDNEKIFTKEEIEKIVSKEREKLAKYPTYFVSYSILVSILTGMRVGEIPVLRWSDIDFEKGTIHIHRQQLFIKKTREYIEVGYTKNERQNPKNGRIFPINKRLRKLLEEIQRVQQENNIVSEFVFCNTDGSWITLRAITDHLRRTCSALGFNITNNHAFRMTLNSNYFIGELKLDVRQRAALLGHSVETNEAYYSKIRMEEEVDNVRMKMDDNDVQQNSTEKVIPFRTKKIS